MTLKEHFYKNFTLAYPVMISQVGHMMVSLADSVMVGRLGAVPLASVALANSIFGVIMLFGIGVSYGMTPLVAEADGANDKKAGASFLKHGLLVNGVTGVILTIFSLFLVFSFPYLDQQPEVLNGAIPYFMTLGVSMIPLMIFQTFRQFAEGLSLTHQAMLISVAGNLINVVFNYIFIYGKLGMVPMGLIGAGWATLISRVLMSFMMIMFILKYDRFARYRSVIVGIKWKKDIVVTILKIGIPSGLQYIFEIGAFTAAAIMIGWLGAIPLAAHQIALNLSAITYMMATGLSAAGSIRMGNQLGRKDYKTLRMAGITCFVMAVVMMIGLGGTMILTRNLLPTFYIDNSEVVALASGLLVIAALFQISDGLQAVGLGVLRGLSDVKIPTLVTLVSYWLIAIPAGYWMGVKMEMGAKGVWYGLSIGLTCAAVSHLVRFFYLSNKLLEGNKPTII